MVSHPRFGTDFIKTVHQLFIKTVHQLSSTFMNHSIIYKLLVYQAMSIFVASETWIFAQKERVCYKVMMSHTMFQNSS